ncbi:hypothetical protein Tsubulata_045516, partial [Turnera subulata]
DLEGFVFEDSDNKDEDDEDPYCPTIRLSSSDKKNYNRVLYDGPWIVANHVLTNAQRVGISTKVDDVMLRTTRVKYVRVCVEVNLTKPLMSKFRLHRRVWLIVYEGLSMMETNVDPAQPMGES